MKKKEIPRDLTGFPDAPLEEIIDLFNLIDINTSKENLRALEYLIMNSSLRKLEKGSIEEISKDLLLLSKYLCEECKGLELKKIQLITYGKLEGVYEMLEMVLENKLVNYVELVLRKYSEKGYEFIRILNNAGKEGLTFEELESQFINKTGRKLDLSNSMIYDFTESHLIRGYTDEKSKKYKIAINFSEKYALLKRPIAKLANILQTNS